MECPHCDSETAENSNFCRKCGKPVTQNEATTKLFPKQLSTDSIKSESEDPPDRPHDKVKMGDESQDEGPSPDTLPRSVFLSNLKCALALGAATVVVYLVAKFFAEIYIKPPPNEALTQNDPKLYFIQAVMAAIFLSILYSPIGFPRKSSIPAKGIAREAFDQFLRGWSAIWVTWLLLYLYLGFILHILRDVGIKENVAVQVTVDFLNASTSVAFFYMFLVLDMASVSTKDAPRRNKGFQKGFIIIIVIGLLIFLSSSIGRFNPGKFELGVYLSGIFAALSMSYVFGRLDSHYMNVNRWTLFPLYLYAVIQVIGPTLVHFSGQINKHQTVFFIAALLLKIYLFIVMDYWLRDGYFKEYFNTASDKLEDRRSKK